MPSITTTPGHPLPLGSTIFDNFIRFTIFSRHATRVWLLLFDHPDDDQPRYEFELDPDQNRTGDIWHIDVYGVGTGQLYLYRMDGPYKPELGLRYNGHLGLIDPYAKALSGRFNSTGSKSLAYRPASRKKDLTLSSRSNFGDIPKGVVVSDDFEWHGDRPLNRLLRHTIIYEAHVRGLTIHPSSRSSSPGTYRGIIDLIPHFLDLGITAIELLPIHSFDHSSGFSNPYTGLPLTNYWGYNSINFFAVESYYSSTSPADHVREFKEMVRHLHEAGIEVILDVVYNHTAEGNQLGPTFSFRGIDNQIYYLLEEDKRYYKNYAGTGNTLNCNHPVVRDMILDSLRYWVMECHVDGFRFDLASILGRDQQGNLLENPPIVERIAEDPILRNTKIIAEAWDAAGAYQVGAFPGGRWAEWNGRYRDDIRQFWRGDSYMIGALATRFAGSSDLYLRDGRTPFHSINFITSHDGYTLNDLVTYSNKHNLANGESNRDGDNNNHSDNMGVEGPTDQAELERLRIRRIKNFLATLMLSQGVPMLMAGDEFRRTQLGNNNAYAQDNDLSWVDWTLKEEHAEIYRFARKVIAFRKRHPIFYRPHFFSGKNGHGTTIDIQWFSHNTTEPEWLEPDTKTLMCLIDGHHELIGENQSDNDVLVMFNAGNEIQHFQLPLAPRRKCWRSIIDTALQPPYDIRDEARAIDLPSQSTYKVYPQSMVVLMSFES